MAGCVTVPVPSDPGGHFINSVIHAGCSLLSKGAAIACDAMIPVDLFCPPGLPAAAAAQCRAVIADARYQCARSFDELLSVCGVKPPPPGEPLDPPAPNTIPVPTSAIAVTACGDCLAGIENFEE